MSICHLELSAILSTKKDFQTTLSTKKDFQALSNRSSLILTSCHSSSNVFEKSRVTPLISCASSIYLIISGLISS